MKTKYFSRIEFWTREFRLPLFWLPVIMGNNALAFYKNSVLHLYYLNYRNKNAAGAGYRFFTKKSNVTGYEKQVRGILRQIEKINAACEHTELRKLSDRELKKYLFTVMRFLGRYAEVYTRTEAVYLSELGGKKYGILTKKLGELRLSLRQEGEGIFYILFGVIMKEIGRRFGIKIRDLFFYKETELARIFTGKKVEQSILARRRKGYVLIITGHKKRLFTGNKFRQLFGEIVLAGRGTELSGRPVMRGKVRGRVRIIMHNKQNISGEVKKFKKGEILVTEMTRPDTVLACRKAAAIITDEGGITSHAAIISRELIIPCIVGTENATQVLKNGDMVEVDADKGIVKKLNKKG